MSAPHDLARMVPGFEFLQNLMKGASASLPGVQGFGQWVAPTLDPAEIDKRIQELKTVQFWLEQNARLLGTTVQALEVQRMTLSTLQTMNLPMADLAQALQARPATPAFSSGFTPTPTPTPAAAPAPAPAPAPPPAPTPEAAAAIDPMQWWGALTQQFTDIATKAVQESSADAARHLAAARPTPAPSASPAAKKRARPPAEKAKAKPPARRAAPRKRAA